MEYLVHHVTCARTRNTDATCTCQPAGPLSQYRAMQAAAMSTGDERCLEKVAEGMPAPEYRCMWPDCPGTPIAAGKGQYRCSIDPRHTVTVHAEVELVKAKKRKPWESAGTSKRSRRAGPKHGSGADSRSAFREA